MMTSLAKNVANNEPYSFKDMLLLSQSLASSSVLLTGGFLMEIHIVRYGKREDSKFIGDAKTPVHPNIMENLVRRYGFPFWFHVISKMRTFHRGASKSLFYWTLMMEYRGLSRLGRFLQAVCHVGMDVRRTIVGESRSGQVFQTSRGTLCKSSCLVLLR